MYIYLCIHVYTYIYTCIYCWWLCLARIDDRLIDSRAHFCIHIYLFCVYSYQILVGCACSGVEQDWLFPWWTAGVCALSGKCPSYFVCCSMLHRVAACCSFVQRKLQEGLRSIRQVPFSFCVLHVMQYFVKKTTRVCILFKRVSLHFVFAVFLSWETQKYIRHSLV